MNNSNGLRNTDRNHVCLFALIVGAIALFTPMAQASETAAWTGGSGYFTNGANWNTGVAPTNLLDTANITNQTAGYTVTLYKPTPTLTNNLLVVSNTTLVITQAVMTVTNTVVSSGYTGNSSLSPGALTLWSGGHLEIDNGGVLNITASITNNDIQWNDPNGLVVLNSGGMLNSIGATNCNMCNTSGWTNHITSTTGSGGTPGSGGVLNYGGNRTLYLCRYATNSTLIIDNGVTVSNINNLYVGGNAGINDTMWITNGASVWLNYGVAVLYIGASAGALNNGIVVSNASLYTAGSTSIGNSSCTNGYLIATAGSMISNSGAINISSAIQGIGNNMILNNSTLLMTNATSLVYIGGTTNYLIITNGANATAYGLNVGNSVVGTNCYAIIDHSTFNLTTPGGTAISIGTGAAVNNYVTMNSATVAMVNTYGLVNIGGTNNNTLLVTGGSLLTNANVEISSSAGGCNNSMTINNSTSIGVGANNNFYVGYAAGTNNDLFVTNGSSVTAYEIIVGQVAAASNCYALVDHSTLNLSNTTAIAIGGNNNYMTMNSATVTMMAPYGAINVGNTVGGTNNTLSVTGGSFITNANIVVGSAAGNCNNSMTFSSSTNIGVNGSKTEITVGYAAGTNDYLLVTNNSALTTYVLDVANAGGSTNCYATFSNATLTTTCNGNAIILGQYAGAMSNSLSFYNSMIYANNGGAIAINSFSGNNNGGSNNVMTFNNSTGTLGGNITFGNSYSVGMPSSLPLCGNGLVITNGSYLGTTNNSCSISLVGFGNYILVAGTNSAGRQSILDLGTAGAGQFTIGSPGSGCWIRVDAGGVISNVCGKGSIGYYVANTNNYATYNATLIITNGGRVIGGPLGTCYGWNIGGGGGGPCGAINAGMIVSGPGSVFDWSTNENLVAGNPCLGVPSVKSGFGTNGYLIVNNGGLVKLDLNTQAVVAVGSQVNSLSNSVGNTITIASGGTLEAISYVATNAVAGNTITNFGGIYQFASPSQVPILTSSGSGVGIYLNSGTISYRSTSNADVNCNQPGKPLDSAAKMTFVAGGTNIFRLNWATNQFATRQGYVFDPNLGATNFYRLEMVTAGTPGTIPTVGGSTCYRGTNGDSLTIGTSVNSGGQMLCSNTAATVSLIFTNNGTLSIENSTLTFGANATINGGVVIDLNNLTSGQVAGATPVIQASSNLTITGTSTLTLLGATSTNLSLIACSGTVIGKFGSVVGLPQNTVISYSAGKIALAQAAAGSTMIFW